MHQNNLGWAMWWHEHNQHSFPQSNQASLGNRYQDGGLCTNLPLANLTLLDVTLTFKLY